MTTTIPFTAHTQASRHPLYGALNEPQGVRHFMRAHVFCVWDFQSLLKGLQRSLTCVEVPWLPTNDPGARRLVNEIVLDEESDEHPDGGYASHFELYLDAMTEARADREPIDAFIAHLRSGGSVQNAIETLDLPAGVPEFLTTTFGFVDSGAPHIMAAAFTIAREDLLPQIFDDIRVSLARTPEQDSWRLFLAYLDRHIETDGERHGPLSHALLERLCAEDASREREAYEVGRRALAARWDLWDAIAVDLR